MTETSSGFHLLADELNSSVVKKIFAWRDHPELSRLLTKLLSHTSRKPFLDSFAEAMAALHLLNQGCDLRFEIPTPQGKRCDFEVVHHSQRFYLHVKRVDTDLPRPDPKLTRTVTRRLRALEDIPRPYIVQARWNRRLTREQLGLLLNQAEEFILRGRVGEEMTARDESGQQIGGVRIIAPWDGKHVNVTIGLRDSFEDQSPRFRKMMERAQQQFMPKAVNVILISSDHADDVIDFESALLGSHIERWDAFPQRGKRLAHGRTDDGFWAGQRLPESQFASWFHFAPQQKELRGQLWTRNGVESQPEMKLLLHNLFDAPNV